MEETKKPANKAVWIILLAAGLIIAVVFCIPAGMRYREKVQKKAMVEETRTYFENGLPDDLKEAYAGFPVVGELIIDACSKWEEAWFGTVGGRGYAWTDTLSVTLKTDDAFNDLTERERYEHLQEFSWIGIDTYQRLMEKVCPDYFESWKLTAGVYDKTVHTSHDYDFYIKAGQRLYKYVRSRSDCYATDTAGNNIHYLTDPGSKYYVDPNKKAPSATPAPTPRATYSPSKKSSMKGKETDPYEADLYDDPDEYADRYAEEFAEEIGEDTDEGYWEAYDHWNDWHEEHG